MDTREERLNGSSNPQEYETALQLKSKLEKNNHSDDQDKKLKERIMHYESGDDGQRQHILDKKLVWHGGL